MKILKKTLIRLCYGQTSTAGNHVDNKLCEEKCMKAASRPPPPLLLLADWVPAVAENYRWGHYGWCVIIPVLSRPDKQRQRILLNGSVIMRHWQSPVYLSGGPGCSRELELHSLLFTVAACDGRPVNVQPQTGTDPVLLPAKDSPLHFISIHHFLLVYSNMVGDLNNNIHINTIP